jgi:hypothetical protein
MRRLCATALTVLLCVHPLLADGPLTRTLTREAVRLAADTAPAADGWTAVRRLDSGASIVITTADTLVTGAFDSADATGITVTRSGTLERVNLDDVLMLERRVRRGSALAAALGAAGGLWLGSGLAVGIGLNVRCQPHCGGVEAGMFAAVIGVPIAAGYGAWRASSRLTEEVVYRRTSRARP